MGHGGSMAGVAELEPEGDSLWMNPGAVMTLAWADQLRLGWTAV